VRADEKPTAFAELESAIWDLPVSRAYPPLHARRRQKDPLRSYNLSLIDLQRELTIIQNGSERDGGLISSLGFSCRSDPQSEN
jgi:hypothetical protein